MGNDPSGLGERVGGSGTECEESGDVAHDVATDEVPTAAPANTQPIPPTTGRPHRQTRLSARALAAASQSDDDLHADPVVAHYRKCALPFEGPSPNEAKKACIAVVEYLQHFLS